MSRDGGQCPQCPALRRQNAELLHRIDFLRALLAQLVGGIRSTITFIETEQETPSGPPRRVPAAIHQRLTYIAEQSEGKRIR
ncbi:hypothetical protein [Actinoplanes sp. NPDC049118]|uniref:hypothetical protein n=1 Tax=Actinoplanes sp. NPDC049118 TaxID=3155769 RepID=UPI0033ED51B3